MGVVGGMASGKSTLITALSGELRRTKGVFHMFDKMVHVPNRYKMFKKYFYTHTAVCLQFSIYLVPGSNLAQLETTFYSDTQIHNKVSDTGQNCTKRSSENAA